MIERGNVTINGQAFVRTYSTSGHLIERNGVKYSEAYDPAYLAPQRIYTETDIIDDPEPTDKDYAEAGRILMGAGEANE